MTELVRYRLVGLGIAIIAIGFTAGVFGAIDLYDGPPAPDAISIDAPAYVVEPPVTEATTPSIRPTVPITRPPVDGPVASVTPSPDLVTRGTARQVTDLLPPIPIPGDCQSWRAVFAWYGATPDELEFFFGNARPWGVPRSNIIQGESKCGLDFINESTSDRYVCQLNGVHAQPGSAFGTYYGPGGWLWALFHLRGGRAVTTQAEASTVAAVPACLWLLRGGTTPNSFAGARSWRPQ